MAARRTVAFAFVPAVLTLAAGYEAAVAFRWLAVGNEGPGGRGLVLAAAMLALLAGTGIFIWLGARPRPPAELLAALIAPAAAAYLLARYYSFDDYYAPSLRRYSDGGSVASPFVYAVAGLTLLAGALVLVRPRLGLALGAPILLLASFTAFAIGVGH